MSSGFINYVSLVWPHCLTVGAAPCLAVWSLTTGKVVTSVGDSYYNHISHNARYQLHCQSERIPCIRNYCICLQVCLLCGERA